MATAPSAAVDKITFARVARSLQGVRLSVMLTIDTDRTLNRERGRGKRRSLHLPREAT